MRTSKLLSALLVASAAFFIACAPVAAQWQVPNNSVPVGRGSGTGFKSAGPGNLGECLNGAGSGSTPTFQGCPQVFNVTSYATAQLAVDAAIANNGGIVFFPCQSISLGSGAIGLDLRNSRNIRLVGSNSVNSGGATCSALTYSGTGTAIDASGTFGFEMSGIELQAMSADFGVKFSNQGTLAAFAKLDRNTILVKQTSPAIAVSMSYIITSEISASTIMGYIGIGGLSTVGDVSIMISIRDNNLPSQNSYHMQNAQMWNVEKNTITGSQTGSAYRQSGSAGTCAILNLNGNDFDDPTSFSGGLALVDTDCKQVNSRGNSYSGFSTQGAINLQASSGSVHSSGDRFNLNATAIGVAINTGNCAIVENYRIEASVVAISGTPGCAEPIKYTWGSAAITGPLQVGAVGILGQIALAGSSSGVITVKPQAAAGTYNYNLPTSAGTAGQPLLSGGGGASAMTFGTLGAAAGGTGQSSYAIGDLLYASGATTLSKLADVATGNALISGGVGTAPSWGKIGLTTHVSGTLPIANGGTGTTGGAVVTVKQQKFTSSGTYTPSTGLLYAIIECVGGGGGGGGAVGTASQTYSGGGGGSGGYSRDIASTSDIGASQTVTIGSGGNGATAGSNNGSAGGDTSVGSLCVGKGGSGGLYGSAAQVGLGGAGGVAGTGDFTSIGNRGGAGIYVGVAGNLFLATNQGGNSIYGDGAAPPTPAAAAVTGNAASANTGGGGSGGFSANGNGPNVAGGNGGSGIVFITEFCNQ